MENEQQTWFPALIISSLTFNFLEPPQKKPIRYKKKYYHQVVPLIKLHQGACNYKHQTPTSPQVLVHLPISSPKKCKLYVGCLLWRSTLARVRRSKRRMNGLAWKSFKCICHNTPRVRGPCLIFFLWLRPLRVHAVWKWRSIGAISSPGGQAGKTTP